MGMDGYFCGCDNGTAALFRSPSHGPAAPPTWRRSPTTLAICPFHETIKALGPFVYKEKYLADSVHPNAAGHALLLEELARLLTQR